MNKINEIPNPLSSFAPSSLPEEIRKQMAMLFSKQSPLGNKGVLIFEKMNLGVAFTKIFSDEQLKFIRESFQQGKQESIVRELIKSEEALKKQGFNARELYIKLCEFYEVIP